MSGIQKFFIVFALVGALVLYLAAWVLPQPPLWASLLAREQVVVVRASVETRQAKRPALPVIDVRDAKGEVSLLQGYGWMFQNDAEAAIADYPVGATIAVPRWDGMLWRGIGGIRDWISLVVSALAAFMTILGLLMVWKLRAKR